ncbi:MAG TPA: YggT family protein [Ktedonobacteraceae bacterium]|nr:YggT family protein [Ktedonobacteraceae bacterium]
MHRNPHPEDPIDEQATEAVPPMEELQPRPVVHAEPAHEAIAPVEEAESVDIRPVEARTAAFAIGKLNDFLQWLAVVLEIGLLLRFILRLIGANSANPFAGFLYALTGIVLYPFANIVGQASIGQYQAFEWSTLIAMLVYWLIFFAIRWFLRILITSPEPAE